MIGGKKEETVVRIGDENENDEFFHPDTDVEQILSETFEPPDDWWVKYSNTDGSKFVTEQFSFDVRERKSK